MNRILLTTLTACFLVAFTVSINAQETKKVISYAKNSNESRIMVLKSDNTLWWYAPNKTWTEVPRKGLPSAAVITDLEVYQKPGMMGSSETRLVVLLNDNTVWWYADNKDWEKLEDTGLPAGRMIKDIAVFMKTTGPISNVRIIALMDDASLWWFAPKNEWQKVPLDGLPGK